jgi:hypothetical protein
VTQLTAQLLPPGQITIELASPRRSRSAGAGPAGGGSAAATGRPLKRQCTGAGAAAAALPSPGRARDLARLDEWQSAIESAERALGRDHPAVGRAWMDLAKALQSAALHSDRARLATKRAFDVVLAATRGGAAGEGFRYLLGRYGEPVGAGGPPGAAPGDAGEGWMQASGGGAAADSGAGGAAEDGGAIGSDGSGLADFGGEMPGVEILSA